MTTTEMSKQQRERAIRAENPAMRNIFDAFNQPFMKQNWHKDEGHSGSFLKLLELWLTGQVGIVTLPSLGRTPFADEMRAENQAALNVLSTLEGPQITVEVFPDQHNYSPDGVLEWEGPLLTAAHTPRGELSSQMYEHVCPPGTAALEIGSCAGDTVLMRLAQGGAVARWPYRSDSVVVIVEVERGHIVNTVANSYLPPLQAEEQ